jgi:Ca-activated chloride channel family protein
MPEFAQPAFLLGCLAVPLLVWWWLRPPRLALRFPDTRLLTELPPGRGRVARWGGAILRGMVVLLLIVALAGPRWPDLRTRLSAEGIAIVLVVDVSGSMAERDYAWRDERISRLEAVKRALRLFVAGGEGPAGEQLDGRPEDLIGLVTFATRPENVCPLTLSHSALLHLLDAEQPRAGPDEGQTNIGDAIAWGLFRLQSAGPRRRVLILLSDGEHNVPPPALKPRQAAQLAANLGVQVYAIDAGGDAAGTETPAEGSAPSAADRVAGERALQAVAKLSGGQYFRAHDTQGLLTVCRRIDRLERQEIQSFQYRRYYEGYPWCALGSFVFLVTLYVLEWTVWRRLP